MRNKVAVVGFGMIKFGELFEKSYEDMMSEAYLNALKSVDNGMDQKEIQAAWLGTCIGSIIKREILTGASLAEPLSFFPRPVSRLENACATGSDSFRNACFAVASGAYDVALALGVEKMRDVPPIESLQGVVARGMHPIYARGMTAPAVFAFYANRHMHDFGTTKQQMGYVAVKNHKNGALDPYAHFQRPIKLEDVLKAPMVCSPLGLYDCCPVTDGAAAVIITRAELAKKYTDAPVYVAGLGLATDTFNMASKPDFTTFYATVEAGKEAYKMAGIGPEDINLAEVHDCFTITEILDTEDLGFCKKGEGGKFIEQGNTEIGGKIPINPSGGLKSKGHPIGATGIAQICEISWHLRNEADKRQVSGAEIGLTHNLGGTGSVAGVTILSNKQL
ncbi:MAG: acetyl-CoA acetyltransferase [Candidatus Atabeyarchaeum deiterrae]